MISSAIFSPCRTYRYQLWRRWGPGKACAFIGLNPSTADETKDDPTIRRCIKFAQTWGYGSLCMVNLFAYRATDPEVMKQQEDPIGPDNDSYMAMARGDCDLMVAAWGKHGDHMGRGGQVFSNFATNLFALKLNSDSSPAHPLYLKGTLVPIPYVELLRRMENQIAA